MSYSLAIQNGDLIAQGGQLGIVSGSAKLVQDLSLWIQTQLGSDQYNPGYGSIIDGGTQNGIAVPSLIGNLNSLQAQTTIQTEIQRIISAYQAQQNARIQSDLASFNKNTLTPDETLVSLNSISFKVNQTTLIVNISITTGANQTVSFFIPVQQ